jgi:hypothetical protein
MDPAASMQAIVLRPDTVVGWHRKMLEGLPALVITP